MEILNKFEIDEIENKIKYKFKDKSLIVQAFTHSSVANLYNLESNERLEFFGDSILSFIVSEKLYINCNQDEGELSHLRSQLVSAQTLSKIIDSLQLSQVYQKHTKFNLSINVKADLFESILGAIYIDGGLAYAKMFVTNNIDLSVQAIAKEELKVIDFKTPLQEYLQSKGITDFCYKTVNQTGQAHKPEFEIALYVKGEQICTATASSKQKAEQKCAKIALDTLEK